MLHEPVITSALKALNFSHKKLFAPEETSQIICALLADVRVSLEELATFMTQRKDHNIPKDAIQKLLQETLRCVPRELDEVHIHNMQKTCGDRVCIDSALSLSQSDAIQDGWHEITDDMLFENVQKAVQELVQEGIDLKWGQRLPLAWTSDTIPLRAVNLKSKVIRVKPSKPSQAENVLKRDFERLPRHSRGGIDSAERPRALRSAETQVSSKPSVSNSAEHRSDQQEQPPSTVITPRMVEAAIPQSTPRAVRTPPKQRQEAESHVSSGSAPVSGELPRMPKSSAAVSTSRRHSSAPEKAPQLSGTAGKAQTMQLRRQSAAAIVVSTSGKQSAKPTHRPPRNSVRRIN